MAEGKRAEREGDVPVESIDERIKKRINSRKEDLKTPFIVPDPPLAGLDEAISVIERLVGVRVQEASDRAKSYVFDANGAPRGGEELKDDEEDDEEEDEEDDGVDVMSTNFGHMLRAWYLDMDEKAYRTADYKGAERLILAKFQVVRDALSAAWNAKHPLLPGYWNETGCIFVVEYKE